MEPDPTPVVERYLRCLVAHDWAGLAAVLSPDVVRVGPFGDTYRPRRPYLEYLSRLMPTLKAYRLGLERIVARGTVAVAQLSETMEVDGKPVETKEALVFDVGPDGLIARIEIYIQARR